MFGPEAGSAFGCSSYGFPEFLDTMSKTKVGLKGTEDDLGLVFLF